MLSAIPLAVAAAVAMQNPAADPWAAGPPEVGVLGTVFPQPNDEILADTLVHQDQVGGADQVLLGLDGSAGGYAAVWSDGRTGNRGLFDGRLR